VESTDERWLLLRVRPYRTADDRIEGVVITLIDITARRRAEQRVNEGEQRLRLAAQSTKDYAIIVQDNDGIIQSWNRGAQRLYGYTEAEVLGKNIDIIYTPEDKACAVRERELASGDTSADDERWHIGKDGRKVYMSGVVTRIEDPSFSGYAKIGRDLTDRKRREEATHLKLRLAQTVRERAVSSNRLKDRFLAILSHELKHPLNLIHVKAEMLPRIPRARDIPEVREAAEAITRAAVSQAKIIDDLLDLSRIRTGKLALHTTKTDAARVLARIVEACTADAHSRGIALSCSGLEEPIYVLADPIRLDQVIWNLVSNALKFTPSGGKVAIALKEDGPGLRIDVVDTGDGIDGDLLPHVFDMFRQGTAEARRVKGGLGIGLALVKQLVEMHGGKVSAHSDGRGHGTRFSLWFPRCSVTATPEPLMASPEAGLRHMRILVVDDDTETANAFGMLLESEGAVVTTAYNAEEALAELRKASFDLLISDVGMAAMDGYEFIAAVRQMPGRSSLPAIALTGYSTRDEHEAALSAGFNAHLSKPVSLEALYEQIKVVNPFNGSQKPRSTGES
jgi:two-component system CheB/CheR fusion protein